MFKNIVKEYAPGCVMILRVNNNNDVESVGTGFICDKKHILTCSHLINLTDKYALFMPNHINGFNQTSLKRVTYFPLTVVQNDPVRDVALLKLVVSEFPANVKFAINSEHSTPYGVNLDAINVGSSICYLGFPFSQFGLHTLKVSQSIISSKVISESGNNQYQLDSTIHEGNSGGPLIDLSSSKIIGIVSGTFNTFSKEPTDKSIRTDTTISYAIPIHYGIELMQEEKLDV